MTLRGPLSCRRVIAWLLAASLLCVVVWWLGLAFWAVVSGSSLLSRTAAEVISYVTLVGFTAIAYAIIFRQSAWFFRLRPVVRWAASIASALILMVVFTFIFQIGFTLYAGW
jgi:hypothetical protein